MMNTNTSILKRGLVKKQSGLVKTWQDKWFVLKGQCVFYYANEEETRLLGTIELNGAKVNEIPFDRDEPEKWLFEIQTLGKGGKLNGNYETIAVWLKTEKDRSDWMASIRRAIYGPVGGGVFGGKLLDVMIYDKQHYNCPIPHIVDQCVKRIEQDGLTAEGIFRLSGRLTQVKELKRRYDEGERPDLQKEDVDIHTAASLLKLYFRELPEPIIPFQYFEQFLSLATSFRYKSNEETTLQKLKESLNQIPQENLFLLQHLTNFLKTIASLKHQNKMDESNLATIFGTNILRDQENSPEQQMATQNLTMNIVLALIKCHDKLFKDNNEKEAENIENDQTEKLISLSEDCSDQFISYPQPEISNVHELLGLSFSNPPIIPDYGQTEHENSQDSGISSPSSVSGVLKVSSPVTEKREGPPLPTPRKVPVKTLSNQHSEKSDSFRSTIPENHNSFKQSNSFRRYVSSELHDLGNLPSDVEDLRALVLSLKLQLHEAHKELEELKTGNKNKIEEMAKSIYEERQAKDEALAKIMKLMDELIAYQSKFGLID